MTRPGFGTRHPDMERLLVASAAAVTRDVTLPEGSELTISAHLGMPELPDEIVVSIRCVVRVGDELVLCTNTNGRSHIWPGGRREPGETWLDTAVREVHEETGWLLDPASVTWAGWLHLAQRNAPIDGSPFPYPDSLMVVGLGRATARDPDHPGTDTEGYEIANELVPIERVRDLDDPLHLPFLPLLG